MDFWKKFAKTPLLPKSRRRDLLLVGMLHHAHEVVVGHGARRRHAAAVAAALTEEERTGGVGVGECFEMSREFGAGHSEASRTRRVNQKVYG